MNDFAILRLVRERHEDEMRQAEHDRLVAELRRAATPTRPEERHTAFPAGDPVPARRWIRALVHRTRARGVLHGRPL
jgi:hypothetical protein